MNFFLPIFQFSTLNILFQISVCIQIFYFLFFFTRLLFFKSEYQKNDIDIPISVIVCVHNEFENIKKLLSALLNQKYSQYEIIIVDDRSGDELYDYLLFESLKQPLLRLIRINKSVDHITPKKYALTLGIKAAKYEYVLLTDADCLPNSEYWINEMQKNFVNKKEIVLGFSPYKKEKGFLNEIIQFETFYTALQYFSFSLAGLTYMGVGRNLGYKKSLFVINKGFNPHLRVVGGDDDLFVQQVAKKDNVQICISEISQMVSIPKMNFSDWFKQKKRHLSVGKHYKLFYKILLGLLPFSQALFWLSSIFILVMGEFNLIFLAGFLIRFTLYLLILRAIASKLKVGLSWYSLPIFDVIYVFYYFITGLTAVFTKRVRWS